MNVIKKPLKFVIISFTVVGVSIYLLILFNILRSPTATLSKSDTIIILGTKSYKNGAYNPCLVSRVTHGVDLYKRGFATNIIMTGGDDVEDNYNEADTMKKIALEQNISPEIILLEKKATSTYENLVYSKEIMKKNSSKAAIIVSEPFHMYRAGKVAEELNMTYALSSATKSCAKPHEYIYRVLIREPMAVVAYLLHGIIPSI